MTKEKVILQAGEWFDSGEFRQQLSRRIEYATESQQEGSEKFLRAYLNDEIGPQLIAMGFSVEIYTNPSIGNPPFLVAERIEDPLLPTLLFYGHSDVVFGDATNWSNGLSPWRLCEKGDRWYGRGTADNKGQHSINLAALEQVHLIRGGKLGFNCKWLFESGEEIGSPGLQEFCQKHKELLKANLFIASDGPRISSHDPTLFLGSRGCVNFRLQINARKEAYHSGNWGGILSNPAIQLVNALSLLVNERGQLQVEALKPDSLTADIRKILENITLGGMTGDPYIDLEWGEEGLTPAERLFGWNTLEILTLCAGDPLKPINAIPSTATAICQLRFVPGTDWQNLVRHLYLHLSSHGVEYIDIELLNGTPATRLNPHSPLVEWILGEMAEITGKRPVLLPNLGGTLPNYIFADILNLPTLWIPHSYPACGQHGANEHLLKSVAREGLQIMSGLLWSFGEKETFDLINEHNIQRTIK